MEDYNIDELLKNIKPNLHKSYNGIFLTDEEVSVLKLYGFDINKYSDIKELMFDLEEYLNDEMQDDLEQVFRQKVDLITLHETMRALFRRKIEQDAIYL